MRIRKGNQSAAGQAEALFRARLAHKVNPVDATGADENDLDGLLFQSVFARIEELEAKLEQREQARQGAKPINAWLPGQIAAEQDTTAPPAKKLSSAIDAYDKTSRLNS